MAGAAGALTGLLLPWLAMCLFLRRLFPEAGAGTVPMILGYGFVLGMLLTTVLLRLWDGIGLGLNVPLTHTAWAVIAVAGVWVLRHLPTTGSRSGPAIQESGILYWVWIALGVLVAIRLGGLLLEILWRPLTPWDAWTTWAFRARAWVEHDTMVPFAVAHAWLEQAAPGTYTVDAWHYPKTVSLIMAWMALAAGEWNDAYFSLPWLGCLIALLFGLYGHVRLSGGRPWAALLAVYVVVSLPLVAAQAALAGYADLWMATALSLGGMAVWRWLDTRDRRWLYLALPMLLFLPLIKHEGWPWLAVFLPALAAARAPRMISVLLLAAAVLALIAWWMAGGIDYTLPGFGQIMLTPERFQITDMFSLSLGYRPDVWPALASHLFTTATWHLLWYGLIPVILIGGYLAIRNPDLRPPTITVYTALLLLVLLFAYSVAADWVIIGTSFNRLLLHWVPLMVFYGWMVLWEWYGIRGLVGINPRKRVPLRTHLYTER